MSKRLFDIFASLFGLVLLLPLFAVIAMWIKADSPGSVFYRQERVGRFGKLFRIHKFRTMRVGADKEGGLTIGADKRITRSGGFLRKYKLDELPQLLDVLKGDMSLVGPRPELPEFMQHYHKDVREKILSVRPGMTDWASVAMVDENELLGKYENPQEAYINEIMPKKAKYYLRYVDERSLCGDILIIFVTLRKIFLRQQ